MEISASIIMVINGGQTDNGTDGQLTSNIAERECHWRVDFSAWRGPIEFEKFEDLKTDMPPMNFDKPIDARKTWTRRNGISNIQDLCYMKVINIFWSFAHSD